MLPTTEEALAAFKQGDLTLACTLFEQSLAQETDPNGLLQAALCFHRNNRLSDALGTLKTLEDRGQTNPPALLLRADIFCQLGRHHHALPLYRALSEVDEASMRYATAIGFFQCGDIDSALALTEQLCQDTTGQRLGQATLLKGRCLAASGDHEAAEVTFGSIHEPAPLAKASRYRRARLALHAGQFEQAESALRTLLSEPTPPRGCGEALLQSLIHSGQTDAALLWIKDIEPGDIDLPMLRHATDLLSELDEPDPLRMMTDHWHRAPEPELFRDLISRLLENRDHDEAKQLIDVHASRSGRDNHWRWAHLRWLSANEAYDEVVEQRIEGPDGALETICQAFFALGRYDEALETAQRLCRSAPGDQYFIALLVTALRCLDDPRQTTLADTDTLLTAILLGESGNAVQTDAIDWPATAAALAAHHKMKAAPPTQSVQSGVQTPGNLLAQSHNPCMISLRQQIERAAQSFFDGSNLEALPEPHPLRLYRPKRPMMHASWAIRGTAGTYHRSHVHAKGWYSGTCYVEVPDAVTGESDAGYLVLGEPPFKVKDNLPALTSIRPQAGKLLLFPSYLWHGTRPYSGQGQRQVVAFDYGTPNRFV
jgi:uncharacterized protein (TIGR02466 family)